MDLPTPPAAMSALVTPVRQFAVAVVTAAAPFAPTSYARARLLRQLHASGLLTADGSHRPTAAVDDAARPDAE